MVTFTHFSTWADYTLSGKGGQRPHCAGLPEAQKKPSRKGGPDISTDLVHRLLRRSERVHHGIRVGKRAVLIADSAQQDFDLWTLLAR